MASIAILGAGAWGTALAVKLAPRFEIRLWARDHAQVSAMRLQRANARYLPGVELPSTIEPVDRIDHATTDAVCCIVATPVAGLLPTIARLPRRDVPLIWLCKGFVVDQGRAELPHAAVQRMWDGAWGVLSGPSFAQEVAADAPTAVTLASDAIGFAEQWAGTLRDDTLRIYASDDATGVEVGGAVKNVLAIATGICDGLSLGDNARAALITRGLAEMGRLAERLGGRRETLMGLSGLGDLVLTATGALSRNRRVGLELANGRSLPDIERALGHVAEGIYAAKAAQTIARTHGVDMPITAAVCRVLDGVVSPPQAVGELLRREPARE